MTGHRNKNKILQARIPDDLDDELRDRSAELGLSVSSLVRNVLMNTFNLVDGVVSDGARIAGRRPKQLNSNDSALKKGSESSVFSKQLPVIGWQEMILNLNAVCHQCNAILPKGQRAACGVPASSQPTVLCLECLGQLVRPEGQPGAKQ